jgi:tRNA pseudouridine55 synthase
LTEGIILLDKPTGQTSFQSLGELKRRLGTRRVGHAGTLDRFAEGLLVVLAGRMTRLCSFATSLDKEYIAVFTFGRGTDTLDPEGATTAEGPVPGRQEILDVLPSFLGTISQVPPDYSAVHVGGRRAYQSARAGESPVLAPRTITIENLDVIDFIGAELTLRISCSKGTYVRSLARDMAARLGTCAFVSALRRTRIGGFRLGDAVRAEDFDPGRDVLPPAAFFEAAPGLGRVLVRDSRAGRVANGGALDDESFEESPGRDGTFGAFSPSGQLLAVVERTNGAWRYAAVFPGEIEQGEFHGASLPPERAP